MKKTILGSGVYNLDIIEVRDYPQWPLQRPFTDREVLREVGGTCGNVMSILAWMGWDSRPLALLDDSPEGMRITADLKWFGCDCRHVSNTPDGGTTMLWCKHKRNPDGSPKVSCRAGAPGGSRFPKRRFPRMRDEAPAFLEALEEAPSVFFFDDPAAGNRVLARGLRERGALVFFEPAKVEGNTGLDAVKASDIIKFSDQNIPDPAFVDAFDDKVFIQTLGPKGVRVKVGRKPWVVIDAVPAEKVVDTEGAGDSFTSAFLDRIAELDGIDEASVIEAAGKALEFSGRSVAYMGSKGIVRAAKG